MDNHDKKIIEKFRDFYWERGDFAGRTLGIKGYEQFILDSLRLQRQKIREPLTIVLDFVERWNKQDSEKEVAEAADLLQSDILKDE